MTLYFSNLRCTCFGQFIDFHIGALVLGHFLGFSPRALDLAYIWSWRLVHFLLAHLWTFTLIHLIFANLWTIPLVHLFWPICGLWPWCTNFGQFMVFHNCYPCFRQNINFPLSGLIMANLWAFPLVHLFRPNFRLLTWCTCLITNLHL